MKNVIFLAPPSAGKGTFSSYLEKNYYYQHFSTGSILRDKAQHHENLKKILESGELVSDDIILPLVLEVLKNRDMTKPFILDGFPRTLQQAKSLDGIFKSLNLTNIVVIFIDVDKEILEKRVRGRVVCSSCYQSYNTLILEYSPKVLDICDNCGKHLIVRGDDDIESFKIRYDNYLKTMPDILAFYKEKGWLQTISNNETNQVYALEYLRDLVI